MVRVLDIRNLWEIKQFIGQWGGSFSLIRNIVKDQNSFILSSRDKDIYFVLEGKTKTVAVMHIYVAPEARGKKMLDFIKEVMEWGKEHTDFRFVFNYTHDIRVMRIMPYFGSERIGEWRGETVYRTEVV